MIRTKEISFALNRHFDNLFEKLHPGPAPRRYREPYWKLGVINGFYNWIYQKDIYDNVMDCFNIFRYQKRYEKTFRI